MNIKLIFLVLLLIFTSCQQYVDWLKSDSSPQLGPALKDSLMQHDKPLIVELRNSKSINPSLKSSYPCHEYNVVNPNDRKVLVRFTFICKDGDENELSRHPHTFYLDAKDNNDYLQTCCDDLDERLDNELAQGTVTLDELAKGIPSHLQQRIEVQADIID